MQRTTDLTADRGAAGPQSADARPVVTLSSLSSMPADHALPAGHLVLPEGRRVYAVGDVHGCLRELLALEAVILADAADAEGGATIIMLGDYVDRGPDSAGAIHHLAGPPPPGLDRICLRGNHDDYLLGFLADPAAHLGWLDVDGRGTLASYGVAVPRKITPAAAVAVREAAVRAIPPAHVAFLQGLPLLARADGFVFVHAGLRPGVPLETQDPADLLLMGDWHLDRRSGDWPFRVVHGHTVRFAPLVDERRVAVDTGAFRTGRLTAARIDGGAVTFLDSTGRATRPLRGGHPPLRTASLRTDPPAPIVPASALSPVASLAATPPFAAPARPRTRAKPRAFAASVAGLALFGLAGSLFAANWSDIAPRAEPAADARPPVRPAAEKPAPFRTLEQDLEAALDGLRDPARPPAPVLAPDPAPGRSEPTGSVAPSALAALDTASALAALIEEPLTPARPADEPPARVGPDRETAVAHALAALPADPPEMERPSGLPGRARPIVPATAATDAVGDADPSPALAVPLPRPRPPAGASSSTEPAAPETGASGPVLPGVIASLAGDNPIDSQTPRLQAFGLALSACCGAPTAPPVAPTTQATPPVAPTTQATPPGRGGTATTARTPAAETAVTSRKPAVRSAKRTKRPRRLRQRVVRRPALDFAVDDDRPAWVIARDRARAASAAAVPPSDGFATRPGSRSSGASAGRTSGPASAGGTGGRETASGGPASGGNTAAGGGGATGASSGASASAGSATSGSAGSSGGSSSAGTGSGAPSRGSTGSNSGAVGSAVGGVSSVGQSVGRGLGGVGRSVGGALGGGRGRGGNSSDDGDRGGSKGDGGRGEGGKGEGGKGGGGKGEGGKGEGGKGEGGRGGGRGRD